MIKVVSNKEQTATGPLPIVFNSDGTPLDDYKLYGTSDGAGVQTESGEPTGYKLPMTMTSEETESIAPALSQWGNGFVSANGSITYNHIYGERFSNYIEVKPNAVYVFSIEGDTFPTGSNGAWIGIGAYNSEQRFIRRNTSTSRNPYIFSTPSNAKYVRLSYRSYNELLEPTLNEQSFTTPIYIGDTKLGAEEYVDYESGKVWKLRDNLFDAEQIVEDSISTASTYIEDGWLHYNTGPNPITINVDGQVGETFQFKLYIKNFSTASSNNMRFVLHYSDGTSVITASNSYAAGISRYAQFASNPDKELVSVVSQNTSNRTAGIEISKSLIVKSDTMPETYLNPTDPPVALPELSTYSGENTLSCSEELGDESQITYVGPVEETITKIMRTEDDGQGDVTEHVLYKEWS